MPSGEEEILIRSLGSHLRLGKEIEFVEILGSREKVDWRLDTDGLRIKVPKTTLKYSMVIKIVFKR